MEENKLPLEEEVPNLSSDETPITVEAETIESIKLKMQQEIDELKAKIAELVPEDID
jgi:hypothetical protein